MFDTNRDFLSYIYNMFPRLHASAEDTPPRVIVDEIQATFDVMGWRQYTNAVITSNALSGNDFVQGAAVAAGQMRLVLAASVETDAAGAFLLWVEHRVDNGGDFVGYMTPFSLPAGSPGVKVGVTRPLLMMPGDSLLGQCSPAMSTAETLTLKTRSITFGNTGEYIPPL